MVPAGRHGPLLLQLCLLHLCWQLQVAGASSMHACTCFYTCFSQWVGFTAHCTPALCKPVIGSCVHMPVCCSHLVEHVFKPMNLLFVLHEFSGSTLDCVVAGLVCLSSSTASKSSAISHVLPWAMMLASKLRILWLWQRRNLIAVA